MPNPFQLHSAFSPAGDQPTAIRQLIEGIDSGMMYQTLLGDGLGKTFTVANIIQHLQRPTIILAPNKTLAAIVWRNEKLFPKMQSSTLFLLRLLPTRSLRAFL